MMKRRNHILLLLLVLFCSLGTTCAKKFGKNKQIAEEEEEVNVPSVHPLVEFIGKEMYSYINKPKYRFYVYMTLGSSLPDEQQSIAMISTVCNVLYGIIVFFGFLLVKREYMLVMTMLTLYIGPAIVLILIALVGASLAAFALYPVYSVLALWVWFFLTSQIAQALGKRLGLDSDKDGDVDLLDLLHYLSTTKFGKLVGLPILYEMLNECTRDPFQEISRKIDALTEKVMAVSSPPNSPSKENQHSDSTPTLEK